MVKKDQRIKETDTYKKKEGDEKVSIKKHSAPRLQLGGLRHKKRREEQLKERIMSENIARGNIWNRSIYFLEPIPEKFGYSLGATPIGRAVAHPIDRSRQKVGEKSKLMIKSQLIDTWFRRNRLHFVSKELWLHCRQNEHRLLPSGAIHES
jgi:hypothetical protein